MNASAFPSPSPRLSRHCKLLIAALTICSQAGCTREFFREWANQDASQAIFEKSRDPRWRIDLFSIDPPALSRFADPYDPDVPPAPPDDYAAQALSPVPQWPDNRLLVPAEGTGYLDLLDAWQRGEVAAGAQPSPPDPPKRQPPNGAPAGNGGAMLPGGNAPNSNDALNSGAKPSTGGQPTSTAPPLPPPSLGSPFGREGNSGPGAGEMSPTNVPGAPASTPRRPDNSTPPQTSVRKLDRAVQITAFQETGIPAPNPEPAMRGTVEPGQALPGARTPPVGMDPEPGDRDLTAPINPRPDLTPEEYRAAEAAGSEMAGILVPGEIDFNDAEAAGLPRDFQAYKLTIEQSFVLGLINSRVYQFQLEQLYLASLAVTLQRFAFQPQFYAGMSPLTGVAQKGSGIGPTAIAPFGSGSNVPTGGALGGGGFAGTNPPNVFNYATRATGSPTSTLSLGTVAGMGKVFSTGGQLLMGFANQVVFNFFGKHAKQPTVQSSLPLTFVQPFLRGGGRAITLEPLTQAERDLLYQVRTFAKFRQEFVVATLVGGSFTAPGSNVTSLGFSAGGNSDPVIGFLNVVQDVQTIENDRKNLAAFQQLSKVYSELIKGESSGLTQLQVDQIDNNVQNARQRLIQDKLSYRGALDQFKTQLGMPPDVPMILDRTLTQKFKDTFDAIDIWQRDGNRKLEDLPALVGKLPELEDVLIDGRSVLAVYEKPPAEENEDELEELLIASERVAFEHRLDIMNARAQLYDFWRQIRVTANGLKGIFNVTLTNQILTPPNTTNPFAFVSQAKEFSLLFNAELPLVRMAERNNFRAALINYQRQRRALQIAEDQLKLNLRADVRGLQTQYLTYEIAKRNLVLTIRQKDQAFEQIIAPPQQQQGGGGVGQAANAATQTTNLINFQSQLLTLENSLINTWLQYETGRLVLMRDLGTLPYDEWEAYRELFASNHGTDSADGNHSDAGVARAPTVRPTQVLNR